MPHALSSTDAVHPWLSQFSVTDQATAAEMLDAMVLVSEDDFRNRLSDEIRLQATQVDGPVALYAEREIEKAQGRLRPIFAQPSSPPRRATGTGPLPVSNSEPEVGSEGIVGQLITEFCRADERKFLNHPGPDDIRSKRVRAVFLATDFIGSGRRTAKYLDAMWQVNSVRSWWALKLIKFFVLGYSGTATGLKRLERHRCRPSAIVVRPCPTIKDEFQVGRRQAVIRLCEKYDPFGKPSRNSIGFDGGGVLMAFAHGIPNNAPLILHKPGSNRPWVPLFPERVTARARDEFRDELSAEKLIARLEALRQYRLSISPRLAEASTEGQRTILVLAALARGARTPIAIAAKTGLTIPQVRDLLVNISENGFADARLFVTDTGHRELKHYRNSHLCAKIPVPHNTSPYYPESLRPPKKSS